MLESVSGLDTFGTERMGNMMGLARSAVTHSVAVNGLEMTGIGTGLALFGSGVVSCGTLTGLHTFDGTSAAGDTVLAFSTTSGLIEMGLGFLRIGLGILLS